MSRKTIAKPVPLMHNTTGSLGFMAACGVDHYVLALVDRSTNPSSRRKLLPVLLDQSGQVLHVAGDMRVASPRFADAIQIGPGEALVMVASRPRGDGPLAIPYFYRCTTKAGRIQIETLGSWDGGIDLDTRPFFIRGKRSIGFAGLYADSAAQVRDFGWKLAYGTISDCSALPRPERIVSPPSQNVQGVSAAMMDEGRWAFLAATNGFGGIELWHDRGQGKVLHRATLAPNDGQAMQLSCPMVLRLSSRYLILWRAWNGTMRKDQCDAAIWCVETDSELRSLSRPKRWSSDRTIPADRILSFSHPDSSSLLWQNGMSTDRSEIRWSLLHHNSARRPSPHPLRPPFPSHIVPAGDNYAALRSLFRMTPYQWSLTAECLPAHPSRVQQTAARQGAQSRKAKRIP